MPAPRSQTASLYTQGGRRKYLTGDERRRFLEAARACPRASLRTLCLTLAFTGCRISEALALTASCVETAAGFIAIRSLKKRSPSKPGAGIVMREVPIPPFLADDLAAVHLLKTAAPESPLWHWSRSRAWRLVKDVMVRAAIPPGPHRTAKGLRHGFGLHAIQCGVPLNLVQRWLGHASMTTTAIYLQAMGDEERKIAERMWG